MSSIIFGTYRLSREETDYLIRYAIKHGLSIDTAQLYKNEDIVVNAIDELRRQGQSVTYTTKIKRNLIKNAIKDNRAIENSIIGDPNLVLLHSPEHNFEVAWEQLRRIAEDRKFDIGVSNFTVNDMLKLSSTPVVNQIEVTPFNACTDTVQFCKMNSISIQAHSSLTKGELLDCKILNDAAIAYSITPAQAMIVWSHNHGYVPVFSSTSVYNISEIANTPSIPEFDLPYIHINYRTHPQYYV